MASHVPDVTRSDGAFTPSRRHDIVAAWTRVSDRNLASPHRDQSRRYVSKYRTFQVKNPLLNEVLVSNGKGSRQAGTPKTRPESSGLVN